MQRDKVMISFRDGSYEDYKERFISGNETPVQDRFYYLIDQEGHQHIFLNGREYAVTPVVYGTDGSTSVMETLVTQLQYDTLEQSGLINDDVIYWIKKPRNNIGG